MASPQATITTSPTAHRSMSEETRPLMTPSRDIGSERRRSMIPSEVSFARPTVVKAALNTTVCVKIPAIRNSRYEPPPNVAPKT